VVVVMCAPSWMRVVEGMSVQAGGSRIMAREEASYITGMIMPVGGGDQG